MKYIKKFNESAQNDFEIEFKSKNWNNLSDSEYNNYISILKDQFKKYEVDQYSYFLIYKKNNKIVAICDFSYFYADENCNKDYIHISYIYSEIKRQGIASMLVKKIIECYPDYAIRCYIRKSNIASFKMFQSIGFNIIEKLEGEYWSNYFEEEAYLLQYN